MRALTLTQPWCGIVASGLKPVENRSRLIVPRAEFGRAFALHAGLVPDPRIYASIFAIAPELGADGERERAAWYPLTRVTGAVLAVASIVRVVAWSGEDPRIKVAVDVHTGEVVDLGGHARWFFGRYGYLLRDVRRLARPVSVRGGFHRGFWTLADDDRRCVEAELASPVGLEGEAAP